MEKTGTCAFRPHLYRRSIPTRRYYWPNRYRLIYLEWEWKNARRKRRSHKAETNIGDKLSSTVEYSSNGRHKTAIFSERRLSFARESRASYV